MKQHYIVPEAKIVEVACCNFLCYSLENSGYGDVVYFGGESDA